MTQVEPLWERMEFLVWWKRVRSSSLMVTYCEAQLTALSKSSFEMLG